MGPKLLKCVKFVSQPLYTPKCAVLDNQRKSASAIFKMAAATFLAKVGWQKNVRNVGATPEVALPPLLMSACRGHVTDQRWPLHFLLLAVVSKTAQLKL
jgi:hypothetical protein